MRIVLRLTGDAEVEGGSLKTVTLADREFFIGRDADCDWSVADAQHIMSRRHCSLKRQGDAVILTDHSSNGTSLGSPGNRLVHGQPTPLPDTETIYLGDHIRIDYECHREEEAANTDDFWGVNEIKRSRGQAQAPKYQEDSLDLLGEEDPDRNNPLSGALRGADETAMMSNVLSLDDEPKPRPQAPPRQVAPDNVSFETPMAASQSGDDLFAVDGGDADDDPFADMGGGGGSHQSGAAGPSLDLDDPAPARPAARQPDPLDLDDPAPARPAARQPDPLDLDDPAPARPAARQPDPLDLDDPAPARPAARQPEPLDLDGPEPARNRPPVPEHDPLGFDDLAPTAPPAARADPFPPPETARPATPAPTDRPQTHVPGPPPPRQDPAPRASSDDQSARTLDAMFAILGVSVDDIDPAKRHEVAVEVGRSFRALADGLRMLLMSRRDVKIALGLGATQIETGSNPLKFVHDANGAVEALLRPTASGFLTGSTAVSDAVTALQQHQVALVSSVKVSMKTALETFDPQQIEGKLAKKGLSQIIPMKRKAELWEQFVENYKEFASEADEDIRRVIGKQLEQLYADEATRSRAALKL